MAFACIGDPSCVTRAQATLAGAELSLSDVRLILREAAGAVNVDIDEEDADAAEALRRTRQRYIEWGAALGAICANVEDTEK